MPRRIIRAPAEYLASGSWPTGTLAPDAPPGAIAAQHIARRLADELAERSIGHRELARQAGIAHTTIGRALLGDTYLDLPVLAALEVTLRTRLWPKDQPGGSK